MEIIKERKNFQMRIRLFVTIAAVLLMTETISAQLPATGKFITVDNRKVYYEESGKGAPLLLLHGFARSGEDWNSMIPELSKSNRVIVVDLPGHSRSDLIDTTQIYLHKKATEIIFGFLDLMKLDSLNVMGFSSGGIIALHMATLQPHRVKKMIIMGAQIEFSKSTREFINSLGGHFNFVTSQKEMTSIHGKNKGELIARQFYHFKDLKGDPLFSPEVLSAIMAKTLIVHGDDDPAAPVDNAWIMFKNIKGAHLWIIPYGEHIGILSKENEQEMKKRVTEFLK